MTESKVSLRYAKSLLDTTDTLQKSDDVLKDFAHILQTIKNSRDLASLVKSPIIQNWKKKQILKEIFENSISKVTFDFLMLITDKHREKLIDSIIQQYENLYNIKNNRIRVKITTAKEIDEILKTKIIQKVQQMLNKVVLPQFAIESNLKGGIQIQVEDWVYDASVAHQLDILRQNLIDGNSIN